jgi:lysophospholipase L1-like esterase
VSPAKSTPADWTRLHDRSVVFFGDSITADPVNNYVTLMMREIARHADVARLQVSNVAVDSSSIFDVIDKLPDALLEHNPDFAIVFVGVNDSKIFIQNQRSLVGVGSFEEAYANFLDALSSGKERSAVLITPPPLLFERIRSSDLLQSYWYWDVHEYGQYIAAIQRVGRRPRTRVADVYDALCREPDIERFFGPDGVHPNIHGHEVIASTVLIALADLLNEAV